MRIAIFSDVHGNLTALEAVLGELARLGPFDLRICAGDVALFGAAPAEAVDRLREEGVLVLRGNTDEWLVDAARPGALPGVPPMPGALRDRIRPERYAELLGPERLDWLQSLPLAHRVSPAPGADLLVVHATPESCHAEPHLCAPDLPDAEARRAFGAPGAAVVAFGHLHQPFVAVHGHLIRLNVASVSMALDGEAAATYAILQWHGDHWSIRHGRVGYDPAPELDRFRERELPLHPWWEQLAARLRPR